jgi:hypothetical protein
MKEPIQDKTRFSLMTGDRAESSAHDLTNDEITEHEAISEHDEVAEHIESYSQRQDEYSEQQSQHDRSEHDQGEQSDNHDQPDRGDRDSDLAEVKTQLDNILEHVYSFNLEINNSLNRPQQIAQVEKLIFSHKSPSSQKTHTAPSNN